MNRPETHDIRHFASHGFVRVRCITCKENGEPKHLGSFSMECDDWQCRVREIAVAHCIHNSIEFHEVQP